MELGISEQVSTSVLMLKFIMSWAINKKVRNCSSAAVSRSGYSCRPFTSILSPYHIFRGLLSIGFRSNFERLELSGYFMRTEVIPYRLSIARTLNCWGSLPIASSGFVKGTSGLIKKSLYESVKALSNVHFFLIGVCLLSFGQILSLL